MSEKGNSLQGGSTFLKDLKSLPTKVRPQIFSAIKRIEKKTFPPSEAFDFDSELKKRNVRLLVAVEESRDEPGLMGYLVYLRVKRTALLHKICVAQAHRRQGIAKDMIQALESRLKSEACDTVQLWVDEARLAARCLYASTGFEEADRCPDYYGAGRTGIKMVLRLGMS